MGAGQGVMARSDAEHGGRWVTRTFRVEFTTPAFLGDAQQSGAWRTPPFKHLLREWWRVAWAAGNDPADWREMREIEGRLFGHAWLSTDRDSEGRPVAARRSRVRLHLEPWKKGGLSSMPKTESVGTGKQSVPAALYLGYGAVDQRDRKSIRGGAAIGPDQSVELRIAFEEGAEGAGLLEATFSLIQAFGTVGGRGHNGWGSVRLIEGDDPISGPKGGGWLRDWRECLRAGWPCAVGKDERGALVWMTRTCKSWEEAIGALARVRKAVNACAKEQRARHVLSQPVPRLRGAGGRMPGSLRFKVRREGDAFRGVVFHMPYLAPPVRQEGPGLLERVWQAVHRRMDTDRALALQRAHG